MRRKANTVASRKAKGRKLTQDVCQALLDISDMFALGLTNEDIRPVPGSVKGEDVWLSPKARECFPLSFECKNQEALNVWESFKQCEGNAKKGIPILVIKRNNTHPKVVMSMVDFIGFLCQQLKACKSHQSFDSKSEGPPDIGFV